VVIVVEKEATFNAILQDASALQSRIGPFILVTGKGYPCLATRELLWMLEQLFRPRILGLFDYDPHGLAILCTYKLGSRSMGYASTTSTVASIEWIGVHGAHIVQYCLDEADIMPLSEPDLRFGLHFFEFLLQTSELELWWVAECHGMQVTSSLQLKEMVDREIKVEIQSLQNKDPFVLTRTLLPAAVHTCTRQDGRP
jgi:DNA topoisomerase VI subunit A